MKLKFLLTLIPLILLITSCEEEPKATCSDGILNGSETAIDCGGDCESCICIHEAFEGTYTALDNYWEDISSVQIEKFNGNDYTFKLSDFNGYSSSFRTTISDCQFFYADSIAFEADLTGQIGDEQISIIISKIYHDESYEWLGIK